MYSGSLSARRRCARDSIAGFARARDAMVVVSGELVDGWVSGLCALFLRRVGSLVFVCATCAVCVVRCEDELGRPSYFGRVGWRSLLGYGLRGSSRAGS